MPADDDWYPLLHRARIRVDAGEVGEVAVGLRVLVVPEVMHRVEELVGCRGAMLEVGSDGTELRFEIADTDSEREPARAQHVEARDLLGQYAGVALRKE